MLKREMGRGLDQIWKRSRLGEDRRLKKFFIFFITASAEIWKSIRTAGH